MGKGKHFKGMVVVCLVALLAPVAAAGQEAAPLTPDAVGALRAGDVEKLSSEQVATLLPEAVVRLEPAALKALPTALVPALPARAVAALTGFSGQIEIE